MIGRPSWGQLKGFTVWKSISRRDYKTTITARLSPEVYRRLKTALAGLEATAVIAGTKSVKQHAARSTIYPDSVGIGHYAIDFHPCMTSVHQNCLVTLSVPVSGVAGWLTFRFPCGR